MTPVFIFCSGLVPAYKATFPHRNTTLTPCRMPLPGASHAAGAVGGCSGGWGRQELCQGRCSPAGGTAVGHTDPTDGDTPASGRMTGKIQ